MDAKNQAEQYVLLTADCWARGVLQSDRVLDSNEQNLFDAVMALNKIIKGLGVDLSHLPPPPKIPHDIDIEEQIPTVRYSDRKTIPSRTEEIIFPDDKDDIF